MVCYFLPEFESASPQKLKKFISSPEEPSAVFRNHIQQVLSIFRDLVANPEFQSVIMSSSPILAPVEFVYIGALISKARTAATSDLASKVYSLRSFVRKEHRDIRLNDSVSKTMFNYVNKYVNPDDFDVSHSVSETVTPRKRRRTACDEDEYRPGRDD